MSVDDDLAGFDSIEEIHFSAALDDDAVAGDGAINFAGFAHHKVASAFGSSLDFTFDDEVVRLDGNATDIALFVNEDIASSLDARVFLFADFVILEPDVGSSVSTLRGEGVR